MSFVGFSFSFGIQPGNEIVNYLKTSKKQTAYHFTQVQNFSDLNCGHLCVDCIKRRFEGMDSKNYSEKELLFRIILCKELQRIIYSDIELFTK